VTSEKKTGRPATPSQQLDHPHLRRHAVHVHERIWRWRSPDSAQHGLGLDWSLRYPSRSARCSSEAASRRRQKVARMRVVGDVMAPTADVLYDLYGKAITGHRFSDAYRPRRPSVSEPLLLGGVAYTPNVVTAWDGMRWPWPRRVSIRSRSLAESMHYDASRRTVRPWQSHRTRRSAGW
jgi:hypothetical protein